MNNLLEICQKVRNSMPELDVAINGNHGRVTLRKSDGRIIEVFSASGPAADKVIEAYIYGAFTAILYKEGEQQ